VEITAFIGSSTGLLQVSCEEVPAHFKLAWLAAKQVCVIRESFSRNLGMLMASTPFLHPEQRITLKKIRDPQS
jgi:hypothetical protein